MERTVCRRAQQIDTINPLCYKLPHNIVLFLLPSVGGGRRSLKTTTTATTTWSSLITETVHWKFLKQVNTSSGRNSVHDEDGDVDDQREASPQQPVVRNDDVFIMQMKGIYNKFPVNNFCIYFSWVTLSHTTDV